MADTDITSPGTSATDKPTGGRAASGPPLPPGASKPAKSHMMDLMKPKAQTGQFGSDPFVQTMQAMQQVEMGIQQLVANNPAVSPILGQAMQAVQQAVLASTTGAPQASAGLMPPPPGIGSPPGPGGPGPSPVPQGV